MRIGRLTRGAGCAILALILTIPASTDPALAQTYSASPELRARIASHPHVRQVADWGSRADWSPDSKRLLFLSREYGDVFELDVASGRTRPMTFHFPHDGFFRAYYLVNGDLLLTAARNHMPGQGDFGRIFESEMWVMKGDLSGPPVPLGERNLEGVAVSRNNMRVAWGRPSAPAPARAADGKSDASYEYLNKHPNQIWTADIVASDGPPKLARSRKVLDCGAKSGPLADIVARAGRRCWMIEPQNFVPATDSALTFTLMTVPADKAGAIDINSYMVDLRTGKVSALKVNGSAYAEMEGVFPDGKSTLVEYYDGPQIRRATEVIDLWRLALDGTGKLTRLTTYNAIDPQLKSNQGVVSPDGRWMAFGVSTAEIEKKVPGQGIGLFVMDLKAAGF
ncbi:MAG TPA: hypothetical protein VF489_12550 [Sphingobium sp.]